MEDGLPIFSTFPAVDAIIQPNILIQVTTSPKKHSCSIVELTNIRSQLLEKDKNSKKKFQFRFGRNTVL
jgi:hypothetical protein